MNSGSSSGAAATPASRSARSNPFSSAAVAEAAAGGVVYPDLAAAVLATNVPASPPLSAEAIVTNLKARFASGELYTRIGGRCLVFLNPCRTSTGLPSNDVTDALSKAHAAWSRLTDPSKKRTALLAEAGVPEVHLFDISTQAYSHMARGQEDQTILLLGETGAGKSESLKMIIRNLCDLSKASRKKSKIHSAALRVEPIFQAFGHAQTAANSEASCFSRYTEFQFNSKGRMVGAKYIGYLLDKSRVTGADDGSRNFNIFYHLLAGATHEEKQQWQLGDPVHYNYLNDSRIRAWYDEPAEALGNLRENLKALGIGKRQQAQIFQLMAAILHLGNVNFVDDPHKTDEPCTVKNYHQVALVADLLGIHPTTLETALTYKTMVIRRDTVSVFLDERAAGEQRDALARALYAAVFNYITEQINKKMCQPESDWVNFVAVLEVPGASHGGAEIGGLSANEPGIGSGDQPSNGFHRLLVNYANEKTLAFVHHQLFELPREVLASEDLPAPPVPKNSPKPVLDILESPSTGVLPLFDAEAIRGTKDSKTTELIVAEHGPSASSPSAVFSVPRKSKHSFAIRHTLGSVVEYDTHGFADKNMDILQADFVSLVRGNPEQPGTSNSFLRALFSDRMIATLTHTKDSRNIVAARSKSRFPSLNRSKRGAGAESDFAPEIDPTLTVSHEFRKSLASLLETIGETQTWFVYHIRANSDFSGKFDFPVVQRQVDGFDFATISASSSILYTAALKHADFLERFAAVLAPMRLDSQLSAPPRLKCENLLRGSKWTTAQAQNGKTRLFLAEAEWRSFEDQLRALENEERRARGEAMSEAASDFGGSRRYAASSVGGGFESDAGSAAGDTAQGQEYIEEGSDFDSIDNGTKPIGGSRMGIASGKGSKSNAIDFATSRDARAADPSAIEMGVLGSEAAGEKKRGLFGRKRTQAEQRKPLTRARKRWLCCTWFLTWWVPSFTLSACGMKRRERQIAWREKVTLCIIIFLMNAFVLFFIIGLGYVLCPPQKVLSPGQIQARNTADSNALVYMYGNYYKAYDKYTTHTSASASVWQNIVLGKDVSVMFDKSAFWSTYCPTFAKPAGFVLFPTQNQDLLQAGTWYQHGLYSGYLFDHIPNMQGFIAGTVVWNRQGVQDLLDAGYRVIIANDQVYDVSAFYNGQYTGNFMGDLFKQTFDQYSASYRDASSVFSFIRSSNITMYNQGITCLNGMFKIGAIDHREDLKCIVPNYILLAASVLLVIVIGFKFVAALQFGTRSQPEDHDKFVICQVPCYTEGETSLRRTIDSLAALMYDDKHKLLFIIADGMIIGSGNDRPTPRIVLDIFGVDPTYDPESFSFESLGEGNKQHNMAKVYAGLYEIEGKVVPYVVVVKVGKPSERNRPGNRGKRDSQLILMRFLSRVHYNQPMNPLELEMYHQMKNVIGVDPSYYEFILSIDADTEVTPDSLNRLVSCMTRDSKVIALCGETTLANEMDSWVTMMQVYEYYISHHLAKAFESLFGSVTCLPGCFSIFRIRTPVKNIPLLVAPGLVNDYAENEVNTLHMKNLLHLGEDRYLTTLLLKHFPHMRTSFTPDARAKTNAPEKWSVLVSQRRRWINSTVHNLFELLSLPELCGFCCFDLRFVVFIDLMATFVQPAALIYIGYLIYAAVSGVATSFPLISLIMLAAIYGFQVIIFLVKLQWQHIGWMIIYLCAILYFSMYIPIYAFWHFDDFSWGNTRMVTEEGQKKEVEVLQEPFNPADIPLKRWSDYEIERLEKIETQSEGSQHIPGPLSFGFSGMPAATTTPGMYPGSVYATSAYGGVVQPAVLALSNPAPSMYAASAYGAPASAYGAFPSGIAAMPIGSAAPSISGNMNSSTSKAPRQSWVSQSPSMSATSTRTGGQLQQPSDEELLMQIRQILATADLMTVTRKSVREELTRVFGVDLSGRKEYIHNCIDRVLKSEI
ncbi:chitin synthase-domain-containing protein [Zopfochytrium polystomum]|nr:chitin synthase-domain-containing protein [Zopfochytrium polystomum]